MQHDIIIVGGGLVGSALALSLAPMGLKVLVLEKKLLDTSKQPSPASRPISLAYGTYQWLVAAQVWPDLQAVACPIQQVEVSNRGAFGKTHFSNQDLELPCLGYVVPASYLIYALIKRAEAVGVSYQQIDGLKAIQQSDHGVTITLEDEQTLQAKMLVAADGVNSQVRQLLGIHVAIKEHGETALAGSISLAGKHNRTGFERFGAPGTLAILPSWDEDTVSFVWSCDHEKTKQLQALGDAEFLQALQQSFGSSLGQFKQAVRGASFPLVSQRADQKVLQRTLLIGNAGQAMYPIAAQGFNLSVRDIKGLVASIEDFSDAEELPVKDILQRYLALREPDQKKMQGFVNTAEKVFTLDFPGINCLRGLGLAAFNLMPGLKKRMAKRTAGLE